ncbi:MAG: transcriptional regulator GcvA [Halofilum sp. (in: g-proteobacteria)]
MNGLPPLNTLRAFEAAARFESFNRAAQALHITPSAVSHQIRQLERNLGSDLFDRLPRKVRLNALGRRFLVPVREALGQLASAAEQIRQPEESNLLTLSCTPSFLAGWLVPRLSEFHHAYPDIEVRLDTSPQLVDLHASDVDACIRYAPSAHEFPDLEAHWLFGEELVPICSPSMVGEGGILQRPEDLARVTLMHSFHRTGQWRNWLRAAGVEGVDAEQGPRFSTDSIAVEAAASGLGVALASRTVVAKQLAEGRVVIPFDVGFCRDYGYFLVYPLAAGKDRRIAAFRDWILHAVGRPAPSPAVAIGEQAADATPVTAPIPDLH